MAGLSSASLDRFGGRIPPRIKTLRITARYDRAVAKLRLRRAATPVRQPLDTDDADELTLRKSDEIANAHGRMRAVHPASIQPNDGTFGKRLSAGATRREAHEPKEFVEPQTGPVT